MGNVLESTTNPRASTDENPFSRQGMTKGLSPEDDTGVGQQTLYNSVVWSVANMPCAYYRKAPLSRSLRRFLARCAALREKSSIRSSVPDLIEENTGPARYWTSFMYTFCLATKSSKNARELV
jgi:hypothetical protein